MKRSDAFPSNYMSKDDVKTPVVVIIDGVKNATLKGDNGEEQKPVMYFQGDTKPLILNNTNWMAVEDMYGDESENWNGKKLELYYEPNIMFGNKRVGGVRIRKPANGATHTEPEEAPSTVWVRYTQNVKPTQAQVLAALGTNSPSEWLKANADKKIHDAIELVNRVIANF